MKKVYKIWYNEQIDDTGIYEDDYIRNTICFVSNRDLAEQIEGEGKKNNLDVEFVKYDIFENIDEVLEYLTEMKNVYSEEFEALKGLKEE